MKTQEIICTGCPLGCRMTAEIGEAVTIKGNMCVIGYEYGLAEVQDPQRMLTTSIKVIRGEGYEMLSVKTSAPIPKGRMMDCMAAIRGHRAEGSYSVGDVVIQNILGLGIDTIATREVR